jgi:hypothetical protein
MERAAEQREGHGYHTRLTWKLKTFSFVVNSSSMVFRERFLM